MAQQARKTTQLDRLLKAMVEVGNRRGYAGASVSAVIAVAGVSRPTFYEYFSDREDCFRATIEHAQEGLLGAVASTLADAPPEEAIGAAIRRLVSWADEQHALARFLFSESMAGGPTALEARDRGVRVLAGTIESTLKRAPRGSQLPDLDPVVAVGTAQRMLGTLLRREQLGFAGLADDLVGWVDAYARPRGEARWRTLKPGRLPPGSAHVPPVPIQQMPPMLPPGRTRLPEEQVAENHRLRILYATARLAEERGFAASTVADIARLARVDGSTFYRLFSDKQAAFTAVHELGFQQVMDVTSKAYFSGSSWPERCWEAGLALTQLLEENPLVARVGFVEAYSVGEAVQRVDDSHTAFTFFLQEGLVYEPKLGAPSRVAMEAIIASVFEIIYLRAREPGEPKIAGMIGYIAHMWMTPFLGAKQTDELIARRLGTAKRKARSGA